MNKIDRLIEKELNEGADVSILDIILFDNHVTKLLYDLLVEVVNKVVSKLHYSNINIKNNSRLSHGVAIIDAEGLTEFGDTWKLHISTWFRDSDKIHIQADAVDVKLNKVDKLKNTEFDPNNISFTDLARLVMGILPNPSNARIR